MFERLVVWSPPPPRRGDPRSPLVVAALGPVRLRQPHDRGVSRIPTDTQVNVITLNPGPARRGDGAPGLDPDRARRSTACPGLARVRRINLFGLSFVTLTFRDGVDPIFARAQTLERLRLVELPEGVDARARLAVDADRRDLSLHADVRERAIRSRCARCRTGWCAPRCCKVDGVADVVSYGGLVREIQVRPDPVAMAAKRLTMDDLETALARRVGRTPRAASSSAAPSSS